MDLDEWRSRINNLDNQILHLLNQRAEAVLKIGDLKRQRGAAVYAPEREAEVFRRVTDANAGPLTADMARAVWREILSACRALEEPVTVAFLAPPATFTHLPLAELAGGDNSGGGVTFATPAPMAP